MEAWDQRRPSESLRSPGRRFGTSDGSIRAFAESSSGVRPRVRCRSVRYLSWIEGEEIIEGAGCWWAPPRHGRRSDVPLGL